MEAVEAVEAVEAAEVDPPVEVLRPIAGFYLLHLLHRTPAIPPRRGGNEGGYSGSFGSSEGTPVINNLVGGRHRNGNGRGHRPGDRHRRDDHRRCHHRHRRDDYDDCGKGDSVARGTMMLRLYTKPALLFGVGFFLVVNTGLVELNLEKRLFRRGGDGGSSRGGGDGSAAPARTNEGMRHAMELMGVGEE